jgi:hypothetical protein
MPGYDLLNNTLSKDPLLSQLLAKLRQEDMTEYCLNIIANLIY